MPADLDLTTVVADRIVMEPRTNIAVLTATVPLTMIVMLLDPIAMKRDRGTRKLKKGAALMADAAWRSAKVGGEAGAVDGEAAGDGLG